MQEIWKPIPGYSGKYLISNLGNVKSTNYKNTNSEHLMKSSPSNMGYYKLELYSQGKSTVKYVHRLVAESFIANPENKPQVNHIDGNKSNNVVTNLEWCSASENQQHAVRHNLHSRTPVEQYTSSGEYIRSWDSIKEAAEKLNICASNIGYNIAGRSKTYKGFIWKKKS